MYWGGKYFYVYFAVWGLGIGCGKVDTKVAALCGPSQTDCGDGICRDFSTDRERCGGCLPSDPNPGEGQSCSDGQICAGEDGCVFSCAPPLVVCDGACRDVRLDPNYCGNCTTQCTSSEDSVAICQEGDCVHVSECIPPLMACDGACRDVRIDPDYCGSCTDQCKPDPNTIAVCTQGDCQITPLCPAPLMMCSGECRDVRIDPNSCGDCPNQCKATPNTIPRCVEGQCDNQCEEGYGDCNEDRNDPDGDGCETAGAIPDCAKTRIVFVTAGSYAVASFGGVERANEICQGQADLEGLPGTFLAWLSDGSSEPVSAFRSKGGPWQMLDGTVVANGFEDLVDGTLQSSINITEKNTTLNNAPVATGTNVVGARVDSSENANCAGWTEAKTEFGDLFFHYGWSGSENSQWTARSSTSCSQSAHLYCFQQ